MLQFICTYVRTFIIIPQLNMQPINMETQKNIRIELDKVNFDRLDQGYYIEKFME